MEKRPEDMADRVLKENNLFHGHVQEQRQKSVAKKRGNQPLRYSVSERLTGDRPLRRQC